MNRPFLIYTIILLGLTNPKGLLAQTEASLGNGYLKLQWKWMPEGYKLMLAEVSSGDKSIFLNHPVGEYTVLYAEQKPDGKPLLELMDEKARLFPDSSYDHIFDRWKKSFASVPLNTAGEAIVFFPSNLERKGVQKIVFTHEISQATVQAAWSLDPIYQEDILVEMKLTAKRSGYFSLASPALAFIPPDEITWGMIPGYFQSSSIEPDLVLSYGYGQGIPNRPVIYRERSATTLAPLITNKQGLTLAVIPEPGQGRNPWEKNKNTQSVWKIGLSLMNRSGAWSPTVYHPVLGEEGSYMKKGEVRIFRFRYTLRATDWYPVYKHAINDIYRFKDILKLKDTRESLTNRIIAMSHYLKDDSVSMWNIQQYGNFKIGAQDYLSSVYDKDDDAMKNSDYGAMWMLAKITNDSILNKDRLPYARNFKIAQQNKQPGFFYGAASGQYYLWKSKRFVEEWGNYVEPIGLTYYVMLDIGNILLFNPKDALLKQRLRMGAERLLTWQHADGQWEVAYDKDTAQPIFTDLKDLRPTFYGLLVAYRVLKDEKYLKAAQKGADWFIKNAVDNGKFLGVCGDFRFVPDFATGQSVQALLDLYDITKDERYKEAAIKASRIYTASVFTHPIPDRTRKIVKGVERQDWEITQVGSRVEQGGLLGSVNTNGPILLASHAGMFVRLYALTKDSLYINMARAAAWGQDAFVNSTTHVASYYWNKMDAGVGRYPHHAWWQIGWITDYLLSEIELRSDGAIQFPRGFITPKVGPHQTYGFATGTIFGKPASLFLREGLVETDNPQADYFCAINESDRKLYLMVLNNDDEALETNLIIDLSKISGKLVRPSSIVAIEVNGNRKKLIVGNKHYIQMDSYGMKVIEIDY